MNRLTSLIFLPLIAFLSLTFLFTSCKKDNNPVEDAVVAIESIEDDNVADNSFESNFDLSLDSVEKTYPDLSRFDGSGTGSARLADTDTNICAKITRNRPIDTFPVTVRIDFGTGCPRWDGRIRKGIINIVYYGRMRDSGSVAEMSFDNYSVDDVKVEGVHRITNLSSGNQPRFKREIINGRLTWPNGRWIQRSAERDVQMLKGRSTISREDDVFSITGKANGENSRGKNWTSTITSPLELRGDCRWVRERRFEITSGVVSFQHNSGTGTLDYGNGTCDQKATLTVNDRSKEIILR